MERYLTFYPVFCFLNKIYVLQCYYFYISPTMKKVRSMISRAFDFKKIHNEKSIK